MLVVCLTISLLATHPLQTLALFGTLSVLIGGFQLLTRPWLRRSGQTRKESDARRHEIVRAVIDSETDIRALDWHKRVSSLYAEPNQASSAMTANKAFGTEIVKNVVELAVICGVSLLILASTATTATDLAPMLAMFGAAAYRMAPSFNRLMVNGQSLHFGSPSLDTVDELLHLPVPAPRTEGRSAAERLELQVHITQLTNPAGHVLIRDKSFTLRRGEILVVTGVSGIGKSSLVKALVDGADGVSIQLNGTFLPNGLAHSSLSVGMAGQRPLVLPATLAYNVLPESVPDALALQVLHSLADQHSNSLLDRESIAGNLSHPLATSSLSGGQNQRIALMRAALFGRDVLILDEPTSALDAGTRDRFMELTRQLAATRIVLIVSHDPHLESLATQRIELKEEL